MRKEFSERFGELRQVRRDLYRRQEFDQYEGALNDLRLNAVDRDELNEVISALISHYHYVDKNGEALRELEEQVRLLPDEVEGWLGIAEHFHYHEIDLVKAASHIETALDRALARGIQVRQVLGVRARIAIARDDFRLAENSIRRLIDYKLPSEGLDVSLEDDFLSTIPVGAIDHALIAEYQDLVRRRD